MSYYKTKKIVLNKLDKIFKKASENKDDVDLNALRLQFQLNFEIGEFAINKAIDLLSKYYGFEVKEDNIEWD